VLEVKNPLIRVAGNQGPVDLLSDIQIAPGIDGQIIVIEGINNNNTVTFDEGLGLSLTDGISVTLGRGDTLVLMYDSLDKVWIEISRSDKVNINCSF
jgi:hypothetical protein